MKLRYTPVLAVVLAIGTGAFMHTGILTSTNKVSTVSEATSESTPSVTNSPESPQTQGVTGAPVLGTDEPQMDSEPTATPAPETTVAPSNAPEAGANVPVVTPKPAEPDNGVIRTNLGPGFDGKYPGVSIGY